MRLRGSEHGIIANATDTCKFPQVATAKFIGQDNAVDAQRVRMTTKCGGKKAHNGGKR
jgi:hypothetical protein